MWKLPKLDTTKEKMYQELLLTKSLNAEIEKCGDCDVREYLANNISNILILKPNELYARKAEIVDALFKNDVNYNDWKAAKKKSKDKKTQRDFDVINEFEFIENIFDYERFISRKKIKAHDISSIIGVPVCVYCNRAYIFTVKKEKDESNMDSEQKAENRIARPEFDHYLPKNENPFFALSLYNLIPSCHICNSSCKGGEPLPEEFNPYLNNEKTDFFKFSYIPNGQGIPEKVYIKDINPEYEEHIKSFKGTFKLEAIYSCHAPLEVKELYTFATKYSDTYLQQLLEQIKGKFSFSQKEAYKMLFGTEPEGENDNKRPLSKLKRDILAELGVITQNDNHI